MSCVLVLEELLDGVIIVCHLDFPFRQHVGRMIHQKDNLLLSDTRTSGS